VAGPWGFAVQPRNAVVFHFVAEGSASVRQPDAETMELQPGEPILFPQGSEHEVADSPRGKAIQLATFLARRDGVVDPGPKAVTLICGQFNVDQHLALPALRALPQAVSLRVGMKPGSSRLSDTLALLRNEVETPNFGNQIVVRNLLSSLLSISCAPGSTMLLPQRKTGFRRCDRPTPRGLSRASTRRLNGPGHWRILPGKLGCRVPLWRATSARRWVSHRTAI
jgi:cupin